MHSWKARSSAKLQPLLWKCPHESDSKAPHCGQKSVFRLNPTLHFESDPGAHQGMGRLGRGGKVVDPNLKRHQLRKPCGMHAMRPGNKSHGRSCHNLYTSLHLTVPTGIVQFSQKKQIIYYDKYIHESLITKRTCFIDVLPRYGGDICVHVSRSPTCVWFSLRQRQTSVQPQGLKLRSFEQKGGIRFPAHIFAYWRPSLVGFYSKLRPEGIARRIMMIFFVRRRGNFVLSSRKRAKKKKGPCLTRKVRLFLFLPAITSLVPGSDSCRQPIKSPSSLGTASSTVAQRAFSRR